jgi:hypothetical protein
VHHRPLHLHLPLLCPQGTTAVSTLVVTADLGQTTGTVNVSVGAIDVIGSITAKAEATLVPLATVSALARALKTTLMGLVA